MNNFAFSSPTHILFGQGQIAALAGQIPQDAKILVTYGGGSIFKNGVHQQVSEALANHSFGEFGGIEPNPRYETLMEAVSLIRNEGYDYLLAVGGGSVLDGTKFIAAAVCHTGSDPWDILSNDAPVTDALPIGAVLTLPATGSETNGAAVITRGQDKLAFISPRVKPRFAVLDPVTTYSLPPRQVANGVVDAFVHVMEQYLTNGGAPVQDRFSEGLLLTLIEEGPKALATPQDYPVRANLMWAATQALSGLIGVGVPQDWATHALGHELTAHFGIDHGRTLAVVLPAMLRVRREVKKAKLLQFAERVWGITDGSDEARIDSAIAKMESFFRTLDVGTRFGDYELGAADIDTLVAALERKGMTALGEDGGVTPAVAQAVFEAAL
ncbi:iron-containing alcohol dehydrogenase [Gallaecimonas pentaromativorans]|uniref:NADP-dependent alcohol dehydrogenase n=1 Tax=Gallaecimonas pentaromativorans TaxID=584787 RepID=A0A3N1PMC1_9GAMM|nr:iron-containing alcohol dehydrogenase [Gallaecimonas pentaromativorans]ROQ29723.1 NADP-dependent alcohol dehydrogenase [Gallaecimonas pentaromativorans]